MNNLLLFFALPVATVILAIVLQKILENPLLVAATFFAVYLIVTFALFDSEFLVFTIIYSILAYITATLTRWIFCLIKRIESQNVDNCRIIERPITINNTSPSNNINLANDTNLLPIANDNINTGRRTNCNCCCGRR